MKVALIQLDIAWERRSINYERAELFARKAAEEKCTIVVFPETFTTGYTMNLSAITDEGIGETTSVLSGLSKKYGIYVLAGFPIKARAEKKARNMAVVYDGQGKLIATYTKIHPFSFAHENDFYVAGENTVVFDIEGMPSSMFICYDLRFPEVFRRVARDVRAIFVIANWPTERKEHWEILLKARAIENQCFVIGVNRTGRDGNGILYQGASHIFDPLGRTVCAGNGSDEFLVGEFDPDDATKIRTQFPVLNDMKMLNSLTD